jgi:hypothetical protein
MIPGAVVVILNGAIIASAPPAQLLFGHVMAPLAPIVTRFTQRAVITGDTITLVRGDHTCVLRVGSDAITCDGITRTLPVAPFGRDGVAYVPLAEVARAHRGARRAARDGGEVAATVRSERSAGDTDRDLHALAAAGHTDTAANRLSQPPTAPHRDPSDPVTRSGELEARFGDGQHPALRLRAVEPVRDARFRLTQGVHVPEDLLSVGILVLDLRPQCGEGGALGGVEAGLDRVVVELRGFRPLLIVHGKAPSRYFRPWPAVAGPRAVL